MVNFRDAAPAVLIFFIILIFLTNTPGLAKSGPDLSPADMEESPENSFASREETYLEGSKRSSGNLFSDLSGIFEKNPGVEVAKELDDVPLDNALKYGALYFLSKIPATTLVAIKVGKMELLKDVSVATARGLVNAMRLTRLQKRQALARIEILKATSDWAGFLKDLAGIANLSPEEFYVALSQIPSTMTDLYQGADALSKESEYGGIFGMAWAGEIYNDYCAFEDAKKIYEDILDTLPEFEAAQVRGMAQARAQLLGGNPGTDLDALLTFNILLQPGDLRNITYSRYLTHRNDYNAAIKLRNEIPKKLETLLKAEKQYRIDQANVEAQLEDAKNALMDCDAEKARQILGKIRSKYLAITIIENIIRTAEAKEPLCWGWVADEFNKINNDLDILAEYYETGRDTAIMDAKTGAILKDMEECRLGVATTQIKEIENLVEKSRGKCIDKAMAERCIADLKRKLEEIDINADCPDDVEFAYVVVRLVGSGFYPHWGGGSHKISGSSQSVYKINKDDDPTAWLEALSESLRGDVCKMVNPWGFGWVEDTPPSLFNQKKPDVEIITEPFNNIKDIDKNLLYSDWKSSGSDGPSLYELRKGCKSGIGEN